MSRRRPLEIFREKFPQVTREGLIVAIILVTALFVRTYNLPANPLDRNAAFLFEQAFDLVEEGQWQWTSKQTIGSLGHYGPVLIYIAAPMVFLFSNIYSIWFLLISLEIGTIYLIYRFGKDFIGRDAGLLSAILYAFSWFSIIISRGGSNEDFIPFFAMLAFYSIGQIVKNRRLWFMVPCFGSLAIILQLHVTAFLIVPLALIFLFFFGSRKPTSHNGSFHLVVESGPSVAGLRVSREHIPQTHCPHRISPSWLP